MSYAYSTSARRLSRRGIAVAVVASLAVPFYGAYAQLGGLVKKGKNRVVEQQVANQVEKRDASQRCRNDAIHASREKRQQANDQRAKEFQAKAMSDPAFREKAMAVAQKMAVAQQKGDTAEVRRLMIELNGGAPESANVDSLAADKACGSPPPQPAAMVQSQKLDALATKLTEAIRQLEEQAAETEVKESKLEQRQYHMARERIEAYLSAMKYNSQPRGFGAGELQALGARRADLEKVM